MQGPYKTGTIGNPAAPSQWDWETNRLIRNGRYRIIKPFVDADGDKHPIGEEWVFLSSMFSKFEDELTLCVRLASGDWKIPLAWDEKKQQDVIERWQEYIRHK